MVQWLRLRAPTADGTSLIPGQGTKIPRAQLHGHQKTNEKVQSRLCPSHCSTAFSGSPSALNINPHIAPRPPRPCCTRPAPLQLPSTPVPAASSPAAWTGEAGWEGALRTMLEKQEPAGPRRVAVGVQYSRLEKSMDRGPWQATVCRAAELDTTHTHTHTASKGRPRDRAPTARCFPQSSGELPLPQASSEALRLKARGPPGLRGHRSAPGLKPPLGPSNPNFSKPCQPAGPPGTRPH